MPLQVYHALAASENATGQGSTVPVTANFSPGKLVQYTHKAAVLRCHPTAIDGRLLELQAFAF